MGLEEDVIYTLYTYAETKFLSSVHSTLYFVLINTNHWQTETSKGRQPQTQWWAILTLNNLICLYLDDMVLQVCHTSICKFASPSLLSLKRRDTCLISVLRLLKKATWISTRIASWNTLTSRPHLSWNRYFDIPQEDWRYPKDQGNSRRGDVNEQEQEDSRRIQL
jgi:hypothetical protein